MRIYLILPFLIQTSSFLTPIPLKLNTKIRESTEVEVPAPEAEPYKIPYEENSHEELIYTLGINLARQLGDVRPLCEDGSELAVVAKGLLDGTSFFSSKKVNNICSDNRENRGGGSTDVIKKEREGFECINHGTSEEDTKKD